MKKINNIDLYSFEKKLSSEGYKKIAGTDEAGRGPMAGPLVVAAVILPINYTLDGLNDSKQLTPKKRDLLYDIIMKDAVEVSVKIFSEKEVDELNVYEASKRGMEECVLSFVNKPDFVLTDAMKLRIDIPFLDLIKGDARSASIAAASVIAKVTRDRMMEEYDALYPEYGFKKHKGYVTKYHLEMIEKHGICKIHRKTFSPVKKIILKNQKDDK